MSWAQVADVVAAVLLLGGTALSLLGAIGILRLPDLLSRMHALTKPQTLGLLLVVSGLTLRLRDLTAVGLLLMVLLFQFATTPVASHMLSRAAFRAGLIRRDLLLVDDLSEKLDGQGSAPTVGPTGSREPDGPAAQRPE
jgi:multicomponent Na+:H+ antiporter subunit G